MARRTSKKDRKNWRDINRDFHGKKKRQKMIESKENRGWYRESRRHSLAARGIKTKKTFGETHVGKVVGPDRREIFSLEEKVESDIASPFERDIYQWQQERNTGLHDDSFEDWYDKNRRQR